MSLDNRRSAAPGYDLAAWRKRIPALRSVIPLNNCSHAPASELTLAAMERYLDSWRRDVMDWDAWMEEVERARAQGKVVMELEDGLYIIEERGEDPSYFMNHSCDPNVWMADTMTLVARLDVMPDEELTTDYALFEASEGFTMDWECLCGSPHCRKRVTGRDWRLSELQERYAGHFLPLIAKRIARLTQG